MRITSLDLINFGVYQGTRRLEFNGDKPVVLIGGMNGRGKTTLLEAILFALYGRNSTAFLESGYSTIGQYLKAHTNTDSLSTFASVKLSFTQEIDGETERLTVIRAWDASMQRVRYDTTVIRNGRRDEFLSNNWSSYVEDILPRALSNFFFFDGEKIAEMALDGSDSQIRESIRTLLGVSTVDSLRKDLRTLSARKRKRSQSVVSESEVTELEKEVKDLEAQLETIDSSTFELEDKRDDLRRTLESLQEEYLAAGGEIAAQKATYQEKDRLIDSQLDLLQANKVALSSGNAPLLMFADTLPGLLDETKKAYKRKTTASAINSLRETLERYGRDSEAIAAFLAYAAHENEESSIDASINVTESDIGDLISLQRQFPQLRNDYSELMAQKDHLITEKNEIGNYLSIVVDDNALNDIQTKIDTAASDIEEVEAILSELEKERSNTNGEYRKKSVVYKKQLKKYYDNLNTAESDDRIIQYAALADEIFERYSIKLQARKVQQLTETISDCYRILANKRSLIDHVEADSKTLEITYIGPQGNLVDRKLLSAGEKQLMVIATLWALAKSSDKKLPVIIDTPLARLDSAHRLAVVESYFPNASDQAIILSTDSEIFGEYYEALRPSIGDEYTLVYNDDTRSTSIESGYFTEASK